MPQGFCDHVPGRGGPVDILQRGPRKKQIGGEGVRCGLLRIVVRVCARLWRVDVTERDLAKFVGEGPVLMEPVFGLIEDDHNLIIDRR